MSKKLNLYLEKIITKMNLDDSQRVEVEREFRAHLEEAVREGMEKGLTGEQAETEAILAFGQPSVIARQFGITHGYGWFIFEKVCFSFTLYLILNLCISNIPFITYFHFNIPLFSFLISLLYLSKFLWEKIEINGTLRIRRIFRKTRSIPFENINNIDFEKGYIFSSSRITIQHSLGKVTLSSRLRNFRCAALALDTLCPDAASSKVKEFFHKIHLGVRKEKGWILNLLGLYWIMILILYSISLAGLWNVESISPIVPISWILFIPGIIFQGIYKNDKAKKGLSWVFLFLFIFYLLFSFVLVISYKSEYIRWLSPGFLLLSCCALVTLFWKGKRIHLVILSLFILLLFIPIKLILPYTRWEGRITVLFRDKKYPLSQSQILWKDNKSLCFLVCSTDKKKDIHNMVFHNMKNQIIKEINLKDLGKEKGYWWITGKNTSRDVTLIHSPLKAEDPQSWKDNPGAFYLYSPEKGIRNMENLPENMFTFCIPIVNPPVWSHDDQYLMTPLFTPDFNKETMWKKEHLAFTHINSGKVIQYETIHSKYPGGWIDENTYETFTYRYERQNDEIKKTVIEIWRLHLDMEEKELKRSFSLAGEGRIYDGTSGSHLPVVFEKSSVVSIVNIDNAEIIQSFQTANIRFSVNLYAWSKEKELLALVTQEGKKLFLVIAGDQGVIKKFKLNSNETVFMIKFSPDGEKVFLVSFFTSFGLPFFTHYKVLDLRSDKVNIIEFAPNSFNFVLSLCTSNSKSLKQWINWSPDSRSIAFQVFNTSLKFFRENAYITEIHIAHYEDWAEQNL